MSTRNSRKKTRINCVGSIDDYGSQSNNDFDSISPESCHYITREQAYSGNEIACEQALFELSLKFEREPAGLANKNASVRCLERRRVPIGLN
jgi:hypothetical protein